MEECRGQGYNNGRVQRARVQQWKSAEGKGTTMEESRGQGYNNGRVQRARPVEIGEHFCGMDFNQPLGGDRVIQGHPLHQDRTQGMGAVAGCTYGEDTLIFVGTRTGHLKKLRVDSASNSQDALLYETLNVTEREPILRDMGLSPDCRFIYVLSQNQVTRLPVESCDQYGSCLDCVGSGDPHYVREASRVGSLKKLNLSPQDWTNVYLPYLP
uniref:Sema domain-containing protein n=1 Tax=Knipowitschia caucasica TaxID=637954 RepID=A0AAV2KLP6_KNICA